MKWCCPHCDRAQVVAGSNFRVIEQHIAINGLAEGSVSLTAVAIGCANEDCQKLTLSVSLRPDSSYQKNYDTFYDVNYEVDPIFLERLIPMSSARAFPDYLPASLLEDYKEVCAIRDKSPKASATLERRCIQGMIRDFCGIRRARLIDEIQELRRLVDAGKAPSGVTIEAIDAIDYIRTVGNIGAHMEQDINVIVSVDPGEAQALIELIEMLFEEWYIARHKRRERLAEISRIGSDKRQAVADARSAQGVGKK